MQFKARDLDISGGKFYIVVIDERTAAQEGIHASGRVRITFRNKSLIAIVDISDEGVLGRYEIGLFNEVAEKLGVKTGDVVNVIPISQPKSVEYIKKKLDGLELNSKEIDSIIKDVVSNKLSQVEMSAFVTACYTRELTMKETYYLTKSVVSNGKKIKFRGLVADKHCVGGISGNRTTMILVPIIASLGIKIPKTSSRSITSPAGTADTMEVLAPVELSLRKIKSVVKKTNGCIVWGGAINLAAADDKLISVRHPLSLDPLGLMLASIMAKKKSVSSNHVIIDIPLGIAAKTKTIGEAKYLSRQFIELGNMLNMKVRVVITEGNSPIGKGIGPALEARDILRILERRSDAPQDLKEKALYLAGQLLELCGAADINKGREIARRVLESGEALTKFFEIVKAQGGKEISSEDIIIGKYSKTFYSPKTGRVSFINDDEIARIAKLAGAPTDKGAGIYLHKSVGEYASKSEPLFTIYAESQRLLEEATSCCKLSNLFKVA